METPVPEAPTQSARPQKPQAVSHMLWFFVIPCFVFMIWAGFRFVGGVLHPKPLDIDSKVAEIKSARTAGDRWQAASGLAQALQKIRISRELEGWAPARLEWLFGELALILEQNAADSRLCKYLLLTLGQLKDARGLPALERAVKDRDPEVRFYAAWGLIEILTASPGSATPSRLSVIRGWLRDEDPALRKVASAFLAQRPEKTFLIDIIDLLKDSDREVRWNAAVSLATAGSREASPVLKEIFDLQKLREAGFRNSEDMTRTVAAAYAAARRLGDPTVLEAAQKLKSASSDRTPEGRALERAFAQ